MLALETAEAPMTADMIAAADFITVYGRDFDLSNENLHGENNYRFSEFALRREIVKEALKKLVLDGFIGVGETKSGFGYYINERGREYSSKLEGGYADEYRGLAIKVREYLAGKTERKIMAQINRLSISALPGGETRG
jgi:hypothetical protein